MQVNAARDHIAPPAFAVAYAKRARTKRVVVRNLVVPGEGHVELIAPGSAAWSVEVREIERALGRAAR